MFFLFVAKCLCLSTPSCPVPDHFFSRLVNILQGHGTDRLKVWENNFKVREMSGNSRMYMYRACKRVPSGCPREVRAQVSHLLAKYEKKTKLRLT